MAWKAVHPDLTDEVTPVEGGPTFVVQFWPPSIAAKLEVMLSRIRKPGRELDPVADYDELLMDSGISLEAFKEMARYGVRDWRDFGDIRCETEEVVLDDMRHRRLTAKAVHTLHVNKILLAVAFKALLFNTLTEEQRGKFDWRSGSSLTSRDTSAAGAAPAPLTNQE